MTKEVNQVVEVSVVLTDEATPEQLVELQAVLNAAMDKVLKKADQLGLAAIGNWASTKLVINE